MNLCFSGLTSCGKTSHANYFGKQKEMAVVSASSLLVEEWKQAWLHTVEIWDGKWHPWIRSFGNFNHNRLNNPSVDRTVDEHVVNAIIETTRMIVESLTAPFLLAKKKDRERDVLLVYFHASHENRVVRAFGSCQTLSLEELDQWVLQKDSTSRTIIQRLWGTDILNLEEQFSYNDVVLNTDVIDNGNPNDEGNIRNWKAITRLALNSIFRFMENWKPSELNTLQDIDSKYPSFLYKIPARICEIIR